MTRPADHPPSPTAPGAFSVRTTHERGVFVVAPCGELDLATAPDLQRALDRAEGSDATAIVLDLGGLTFIDSTGLTLVLEADARSRGDGERLRLVPGPDSVQRVFGLCGVDDRLPFVR